MKRRFAAVALLSCLIVPLPAAAADQQCRDPDITINAEAMSDEEIAILKTTLHAAILKVCGWWGPTFDAPYTVNVKNDRGPSMAMIPYWRGNPGTILLRSQRTRRGRSPILHEVVHIFAPNANRFVAEGLAVYAHEKLGGQSAYPTFGQDLHAAAKPIAPEADLPALDSIVTPKGLRTENRPEQKKAYTVAGSFVRYLIETEGLENFRALYGKTPLVQRERIESDPDRWQEVYGHSLDELTERWRKFISNHG